MLDKLQKRLCPTVSPTVALSGKEGGWTFPNWPSWGVQYFMLEMGGTGGVGNALDLKWVGLTIFLIYFLLCEFFLFFKVTLIFS